ncbi:uncharacterized protein LOC124163440 isoform X2 [Ischnura elegans]|nr:uncharacterized protein LOC124163440 isoform X2 [Ischnura elegans]XP_046396306.1 uncharacterized protein LOC124163440 isoform X2 [Ischnura elegans]
MDCNVKKKRRRTRKKKKITDNSSEVSEDINYNIIYEPDQWSPTNLEGKKKYGRRFLLRLRFFPVCLKKPDNLLAMSDLSEIVLENCMQEEMCPLCSCPPPDSKLVTTKNCVNSVMKTNEALEKELTFKIVPEDILMRTPRLAEFIFCDSSNLNEAAAYTVLQLENLTVMPLTKKTEIPITSNGDLAKPQLPVDFKKYDREFLLKLHSYPLCLKRPESLTYENVMKPNNPDGKHMNCHICVRESLLQKQLSLTSSKLPVKWDDDAVLLLIKAYEEEAPRNVPLEMHAPDTWYRIAQNLMAKDVFPKEAYAKSTDCKSKMCQLALEYKSMLNLSNEGDLRRNNWPFFEVLDSIFKSTPGDELVVLEDSSASSSLPEPSFSCSSQNSLDVQQGSEGKCKWDHDSILLLIQAYKEEDPKIKSGQISKRKAWEKITGILQAKGITTCYSDCRTRMNVLKREYESMLNLNDGNDLERKKWPYFELLDDIFSKSQSGEPVLQSESTIQASIQESSTSNVSNGLPSVHTLDLGKQEGLSHEERRPFRNAWQKEKENIKKNYEQELQRQNQLLEEMEATANPSLPESFVNSPSHSIPDMLQWNKGPSKGLNHEDMKTIFNALEKERENFNEKHKQELQRQDQLLQEMLTSIHPSLPESSPNSCSGIPDMLRWNTGPCTIFSDDDIKTFMGATENCQKEWREKYRQLLFRQDQLLEDLSQYLNE